MRICKVWDADYPWDIRVEKIASTLAAAGHSVHLVCRNESRRVRREWNGCFTIHRLPSFAPMLGPVNTLANSPHPLNPLWAMTIAATVRECQADIILVRDIPLVLAAVAAGRRHRIPVVLDMAENYPAMLRDRLAFTPTAPLGRLVRHPALARLVERLGLRAVDHVIVVVEESRDRLLRAGVPAERLTIVCNTPPLDRWRPREGSTHAHDARAGARLVYLGNLDGSRGVDVAIRAIRHLKDQGRPARLAVIGDGPNMRQLRELTQELGVGDRVSIMGRLSFERVQAIMAEANVGLIPHYATEAWNTTIPNKLFDYMLLGLPVIVSDARPTARIVRTEDCGEVHRDRDAADLAACISTLAQPEVRQAKGARGQAAVLRRYNWSHDSRAVVQTMELVGKVGTGARPEWGPPAREARP